MFPSYRTKTRISKEDYGERIQAIENGENVESEEETDEDADPGGGGAVITGSERA